MNFWTNNGVTKYSSLYCQKHVFYTTFSAPFWLEASLKHVCTTWCTEIIIDRKMQLTYARLFVTAVDESKSDHLVITDASYHLFERVVHFRWSTLSFCNHTYGYELPFAGTGDERSDFKAEDTRLKVQHHYVAHFHRLFEQLEHFHRFQMQLLKNNCCTYFISDLLKPCSAHFYEQRP